MNLDSTSRLKVFLPFAVAAVPLFLLHAATDRLMSGTQLDLGSSINLPTEGYGRFLALWMFFATGSAAALTLGFARVIGASPLRSRFVEAWGRASDRKWIFYSSLFGLLIPATLRTFLLDGAPLTDDESAYRFMAQVLAAGDLHADSPPLKLFFDNRFMINDGKFYSHFFLGWPALMVPGVWLGATGFVNSVYSALTVPALFLVLRRLTGHLWARAGVVLYLCSPMLMVAAATETSHTSCVMSLAWCTWACVRAREPGAPWWIHSAVAAFFSVAFFVRPTAALGVGVPFLLWWLVSLRRRSLIRAGLAFAVPAIAMAMLFLAVNKSQTGSYFEVAYQRAYTYAEENDFRFSLWDRPIEGGFSELEFSSVGRSLAVSGAALFRLNVTLLGWPCSLLFALWAGRGPARGVLGLSVLSFLAVHFLSNNVGIDTFAPMHYFELAWPLLLLSVCGLQSLTQTLSATRGLAHGWAPQALPAAAAGALILVGLVSYVPVRFGAIARVAQNISLPQKAVLDSGLGRSVVFSQEPFIQYCRSTPAKGWVFARPNNDPLLENHVLWVNHLSVEKNKLLMRQFPDREGYVMGWNRSCQVVLVPLAALKSSALPDNPVSGIEKVGNEPGITAPQARANTEEVE